VAAVGRGCRRVEPAPGRELRAPGAGSARRDVLRSGIVGAGAGGGGDDRRGALRAQGRLLPTAAISCPRIPQTGGTTTTSAVVVSSVRAGTRTAMRFSPRVSFQELPGLPAFQPATHVYPFPEDVARRTGKRAIQQLSGVTGDGETRTRTGDTAVIAEKAPRQISRRVMPLSAAPPIYATASAKAAVMLASGARRPKAPAGSCRGISGLVSGSMSLRRRCGL
jgi:hypothetical protein